MLRSLVAFDALVVDWSPEDAISVPLALGSAYNTSCAGAQVVLENTGAVEVDVIAGSGSGGANVGVSESLTLAAREHEYRESYVTRRC